MGFVLFGVAIGSLESTQAKHSGKFDYNTQ